MTERINTVMLKKLIDGQTCASCRICCEYDDSDVWDAPGFTQEEWDRAKIADRFGWSKRGDLYYLDMEKDMDGLYHCPCLSENGCILGDKKPFRCALWPLYVVRDGGGLYFAVSDVCPQVYPMDDERILSGISHVAPMIREAAKRDPSLVEELHENYRILADINEVG